ncbi:MAG: ABC-ATPase domain-containing protein [Thermoplasmata archaeon]|nr:ABC-ATPase domain-containing protein [Thermoplasmata archaeon]
MKRLRELLKKLDGKGYKAYKMLQGKYKFNEFILFIDHVQGDPFASPSMVHVEIELEKAGFPLHLLDTHKVAFEDFLNRRFYQIAKKKSRKRGSGNSGMIMIQKPSQCILKRDSIEIEEKLVARFFVGLPAYGRRIEGKQAIKLLLNDLPHVIERSLFFKHHSYEEIERHVKVAEDADFIRKELRKNRLVAFIANNSILPRKSGVEDEPLSDAIPFVSPPSMEIELECPNRKIKGMGIKEGVTLIVGGAYHGKSTLLNAIAMGVYNHLPGDGREFVITREDAVKIRAEDGRFVNNVCIYPFITNLPKASTKNFSTENASGSTSQAANIMEALEAGSRLLLIDEDTSATNLMMRDRKMQELIPKEKEPITPIIDMIPAFKKLGVSMIMVAAGLGEYFDVADYVIGMDEYLAKDLTSRAKEIAREFKSNRIKEIPKKIEIKYRKARKDSVMEAIASKRKIKVSDGKIKIGKAVIDLTRVEQIAEEGQLKAIGELILKLKYKDCLKDELSTNLWNMLSPKGIYVEPRKYEVAAALNRMRGITFEDC